MEQGIREPDTAVRDFLRVIAHDPEAVMQALKAVKWFFLPDRNALLNLSELFAGGLVDVEQVLERRQARQG